LEIVLRDRRFPHISREKFIVIVGIRRVKGKAKISHVEVETVQPVKFQLQLRRIPFRQLRDFVVHDAVIVEPTRIIITHHHRHAITFSVGLCAPPFESLRHTMPQAPSAPPAQCGTAASSAHAVHPFLAGR